MPDEEREGASQRIRVGDALVSLLELHRQQRCARGRPGAHSEAEVWVHGIAGCQHSREWLHDGWLLVQHCQQMQLQTNRFSQCNSRVLFPPVYSVACVFWRCALCELGNADRPVVCCVRPAL